MARVRAYIGLGANLGDAAGTLAAAVHALAALPDAALAGVSRLYATAPVGVTDQPEFRNAVVALDVPAGPDAETGASALLIALKDIERAFGRQARERWGPREVDLDLLLFGDARIERRAAARGPQRRPGQGVDCRWSSPTPRPATACSCSRRSRTSRPDLVPPGLGETVADGAAAASAAEGPDAVRPIATWDGDGWRPLA